VAPPSNSGDTAADTIAAIATGSGGGVGIVRLSGPHAEAILRALVAEFPKKAQTHRLYLGDARDPEGGEAIDQVLACVMRAPRSYTGEDVAELQGHGGALVLDRVLKAALRAGARLAQPGEFTRRAFLAGRIDLTQAEAVADLIAARSTRALRSAEVLRAGALGERVTSARAAIVRCLGELEGALDFPDEHLEAEAEAETGRTIGQIGESLASLAATHRPLADGRTEVALIGRVNAGKSSLLNALCGEERALVDARAGTTRDAVEAEVDLGGVTVTLVDTAGERDDGRSESADELEGRGIALGRKRRDRAGLVILVIDGERGLGDEDRRLAGSLAGAPHLVVWNKSDLAEAPSALLGAPILVTSARTGQGIDGLKRAIASALGADEGEAEGGLRVTSHRHAEALSAAAARLGEAAQLLIDGAPAEVAAVEARRALNHLGQVTGETADSDVLDAIFARFCIGK
jgi:tRNA modification GTPase